MRIEISTDQLAGDISSMQSRADDLENAKNQVFACLDNLNGMWVGSAHEAFVQQTQADQEELLALIKNLSEIISCMEYAKQEYDGCHDSVNELLASIQISAR